MNKKYLRAKDVAEYLSIGRSTVWWLCKNKKLSPIKLSARITVFDIDNVNELLDNTTICTNHDRG